MVSSWKNYFLVTETSSKRILHISAYVIIIIFLLLLLLGRAIKNPVLLFNLYPTAPPIIYENFTCETPKKFSFVDSSRYQQCLSWGVDGSFWAREELRHIAHKGLLNSESLIVEIGGNRGHDTVKFIELYNASIISYEPLLSMWKALTVQFQSNPKVEIHPYGLSNHARNVFVEPHDVGNAGTSTLRKLSSPNSTSIELIHLLNVVEVVQHIRKTRTKNGIIDMISINCEGCEFEVLPALIVNGMTQYFRIIQFATHSQLLSTYSCVYCQIEAGLEKTHRTLYHYRKLWEGWVLKNKTL